MFVLSLSRSRLCHAFCPPWACACQPMGLLARAVASVPLMTCLDVTTCETHFHDVGVLDTHLSPLHAMMLYFCCLLCATHLAFFASLHFCTLAYMSCMIPCLLVSSSLILTISCGFTPVVDTKGRCFRSCHLVSVMVLEPYM